MYSVELLSTHMLLQVLLTTSLTACDDTAATVSIILYLRLIASHPVPEDPSESCKKNLKRVYRVDV